MIAAIFARKSTIHWPRILLALVGLLIPVTSAAAERMWVLWVEAPAGSDQWSLASIAEPRFKAEEDCQRRAQDLNDFMCCWPRCTGVPAL